MSRAAKRASETKRRAQIWAALNPTGSSCASRRTDGTFEAGESGNPTRFAADTAQSVGRSKASINRDLHRAEALGDDLQEVQGTSLDKGVELDALAAMEAAERAAETKRRAQIWAALHPDPPSGSTCATRSPGGRFAAGALEVVKVAEESEREGLRRLGLLLDEYPSVDDLCDAVEATP